jgi:hypothetical protein
VLKTLELPEPVLEYLHTHDSPDIVGYFTEGRLRELVALKNPRKIWGRFQEMLQNFGDPGGSPNLPAD